MIKFSTRTLLSSLVVATAVLSAGPVTTAQARSSDYFERPMYQNHNGDLLRLLERRSTKYGCNSNNGICPNPGPPRIYYKSEPGSFWRLIDICEYLKGLSCFIDTYQPDDNN